MKENSKQTKRYNIGHTKLPNFEGLKNHKFSRSNEKMKSFFIRDEIKDKLLKRTKY